MKKSEYLEKYGFEIPFTEKELSMVGMDLQFTKGDKDEILNEGVVTDLRFGDSTVVRNGVKYLTIQFAIDEWWSMEFPTDILAPFIYDEYEKDLLNKFKKKL